MPRELGPDDWEAEADLRSLMEAEDTRSNPARIERARRFADKKREDLADTVSRVLPPVRRKGFNGAAQRPTRKR